MNKGAAGALALVLFWIAFVSFFVSFHPGGLQIDGHPAQNPRDVILWLIRRAASGPPASANPQTEVQTA